MAYFLQTFVPEKKKLKTGLTRLLGIGPKTGRKTLRIIGLCEDAKGKDLRRLHRLSLKADLENYPTKLGKDLNDSIRINIQNIIKALSYKGARHRAGFPTRGQRTHTNAKTQKRLHLRWKLTNYQKLKKVVTKKKSVLSKKKVVKKAAKKKEIKTKTSKPGKYKV